MKQLLLLLFPLLVARSVFPQTAPDIQWQQSLGSTTNDYAWSVRQTSDGGYIMGGDVSGNPGNVSGFHGGYYDVWIVKLDAQGALQWQRALGGSGSEGAQSVLQTTDGGYVIVGGTNSTDGDVAGIHDGADVWVVKIHPDGTADWSRTYGGSNDDAGHAIQQTSDGGYIIAGESRSSDGDLTSNQGGVDSWVLKIDGSGELQWQKSLGGSGYDDFYSIQQASDGGYIMAGESSSNDGDVIGNHGGMGSDYWVVKLDSAGNMDWQKALGGSNFDIAHSIIQTEDGGYIVAGEADSDDGDVVGFLGGSDYWVVKLDPTGTIQWQQCLGGSNFETATAIRQLDNGDYIVAGYTESDDGQVSNYHGGPFGDAWIVRLNGSGELLWQKTLGGTGTDKAFAIQPTTGGGYIVAGFSDSNDEDVSGNHGGRDCWVVKLGPDNVGFAELENEATFSLFPNPSTDGVHIEFNSTSSAKARLQLYNAAGQLVKTPVDEWIPAGKHSIRYSTEGLAAGTYELRLSTGGRTFTRRLVKL